jgi:hypothetical protein
MFKRMVLSCGARMEDVCEWMETMVETDIGALKVRSTWSHLTDHNLTDQTLLDLAGHLQGNVLVTFSGAVAA